MKFVSIAYLICTFCSLGIFIWLYLTDVKKSLCQNIMVLITTISYLGYFTLSVSTELNEAILATKIVYLSGCFIPMLFFFVIADICKIPLHKKMTIPLITIQLILFGFVCTIGFSDLYYKNVNLEFVNGIYKLTKQYGPTHFLYTATMIGYFIAGIGISFYLMLRKRKNINYKELRIIFVFSALAISLYGLRRILNTQADIASFSNILLLIGAMTPIYHTNLFTVNENINIVNEQLNKLGYITFDKKLNYMGSNKYASSVFSELENCRICKPIKTLNQNLIDLIHSVESYQDLLIFGTKKKGHNSIKSNNFKYNDRVYETKIHTINDFLGRILGFTIEFIDETEHYRAIELTERYNETLSKEVSEKTKRIRSIQEKTILGMAQMVESRDLSTGGHIKRTSDVVKIFSNQLLFENIGVSEDYLGLVIRSAPMHDLGKIGVDDAILRKRGKFTESEYSVMKKHSAIGGKMIKDILTDVEEKDFVNVSQNVAHYHHEKYDGSGYPDGLKAEDIPLEARIMALADVFDALVSERCYKEAFSYDKAFSIIKEDSGTHFDPKLAEIFLKCRDELENYYKNCEKK